MNPWAENNTNKKQPSSTENLDLGKIATVFIICGLLSLLTAWFYGFSKVQTIDTSISPDNHAIAGPIYVKKHKESYNIAVSADIAQQSWLFIEGEVLDRNKEYLFSFGKELWHEAGRDAEGPWREVNNRYDVNMTFPNPGNYYIKFKTENASRIGGFSVVISKKNGSSLPHLWFGIITLIIGIILNEAKSRTIRNFIETAGA